MILSRNFQRAFITGPLFREFDSTPFLFRKNVLHLFMSFVHVKNWEQ